MISLAALADSRGMPHDPWDMAGVADEIGIPVELGDDGPAIPEDRAWDLEHELVERMLCGECPEYWMTRALGVDLHYLDAVADDLLGDEDDRNRPD